MLSQLWSEYGLLRQKHIWIVSICIKQKDITYKNLQVSLMANIYQMAVGVLSESVEQTNPATAQFQHLIGFLPSHQMRMK